MGGGSDKSTRPSRTVGILCLSIFGAVSIVPAAYACKRYIDVGRRERAAEEAIQAIRQIKANNDERERLLLKIRSNQEEQEKLLATMHTLHLERERSLQEREAAHAMVEVKPPTD